MADAYYTVPERTTQRYTATIKDELGAAVPAASLLTLTLTLHDVQTGTLLGGRPAQQNVKNANNVTVDSAGNLVWLIQPADNAIVTDTLLHEQHIALFEFTYTDSGGNSARGQHEVQLTVINAKKVPAS